MNNEMKLEILFSVVYYLLYIYFIYIGINIFQLS